MKTKLLIIVVGVLLVLVSALIFSNEKYHVAVLMKIEDIIRPVPTLYPTLVFNDIERYSQFSKVDGSLIITGRRLDGNIYYGANKWTNTKLPEINDELNLILVEDKLYGVWFNFSDSEYYNSQVLFKKEGGKIITLSLGYQSGMTPLFFYDNRFIVIYGDRLTNSLWLTKSKKGIEWTYPIKLIDSELEAGGYLEGDYIYLYVGKKNGFYEIKYNYKTEDFVEYTKIMDRRKIHMDMDAKATENQGNVYVVIGPSNRNQRLYVLKKINGYWLKEEFQMEDKVSDDGDVEYFNNKLFFVTQGRIYSI